MLTPMEYAALQCLIAPQKKRLPAVKPLSKLRDHDKPYKPKYHDPLAEDLSKPQYRLIKIGNKKTLVCTRKAPSPIIKVIKVNE